MGSTASLCTGLYEILGVSLMKPFVSTFLEHRSMWKTTDNQEGVQGSFNSHGIEGVCWKVGYGAAWGVPNFLTNAIMIPPLLG